MEKTNNSLWIISLVVVIGLVLGYLTTKGTKSQWIRLIDIFVIGPLMIYLGYHVVLSEQTRVSPNWLLQIVALVIVFFGATTMTYNLRNYIHQSKNNSWL